MFATVLYLYKKRVRGYYNRKSLIQSGRKKIKKRLYFFTSPNPLVWYMPMLLIRSVLKYPAQLFSTSENNCSQLEDNFYFPFSRVKCFSSFLVCLLGFWMLNTTYSILILANSNTCNHQNGKHMVGEARFCSCTSPGFVKFFGSFLWLT